MQALVIVQKEGSNRLDINKKGFARKSLLVLADKMFNKKIALI
jgi:hypothetical protein